MKVSLLTLAVQVALFAPVAPLLAAESAKDAAQSDAEVIEVRGLRDKLTRDGRLADVIQKTEVLDKDAIAAKNALSLSEAIQDEPGVRVSNECSMCGVKRVMINGMKGEHTTILIDGLPAHTLISGFYGVDAVATTGVERIEIARGAGASLIAPEAVGGTINVISSEALKNAVLLDLAGGTHGFRGLKASATGVSDDGATGLALNAQSTRQDQEDHDDNGVSEAPFQKNEALSLRLSHDLDLRNNLQVRLSRLNSEVFGGPLIGTVTPSIQATLRGYDGIASPQLFLDNDVRKRYIGKPWETAEWIDTRRTETYAKWLHETNANWTQEISLSQADHAQDSFYEGIDYRADDRMRYLRGKFDWRLNQQHLLTFGVDDRQERMRSDSQTLSESEHYIRDSFDYDTRGVFFQDTWTVSEQFELASALRLDQVHADFVDRKKPGVEIDENLLSPRFDARWFHSPEWTSRLSVGRGYRAPLSFFETDHGILDTGLGYQIDVSNLERSRSFTYALSHEGSRLTSTLSVARTDVENLAALAENENGVPVLTQLRGTAAVTTVDWVAGYKFSDEFQINGSLENFRYDRVFSASYAIAPIEERASLEAIWAAGNWHLNLSTVWFGHRDLRKYGYEGFDIAGDARSQKPLEAPAFATVNFKLRYALTRAVALYAGAGNLLDKTQINDGQTPLFFDADGHYDVGYIYGPLHGRELYAGLEIKL